MILRRVRRVIADQLATKLCKVVAFA